MLDDSLESPTSAKPRPGFFRRLADYITTPDDNRDLVAYGMEGHDLPNDPASVADARRTVRWLNTPQGERAIREVIGPALQRTTSQPRNDTLVVTPRRRLGLLGVREGGPATRHKVGSPTTPEV
jgi:hypothetical protein